MNNITIGVIVVSLLVLGVGGYLISQSSGTVNNDPIELVQKVKGNPEAEVVLSEYSDFQCPACAAFQPVLNDVMEQYGDQLRLEYNHFPLISIHRNAEQAARASEAAGVQGQFWEFHDLLFERQQTWSQSINPRTVFIGYAEELGLNVEQFTRDLDNRNIREAVQNEMRAGRELSITGTPTFFLNGEPMQYETFNDFVTEIERALGVAVEEVPLSETEVDFSF